jgi:predicted AlkP superfamily phosphohydrolase/phosphomutase
MPSENLTVIGLDAATWDVIDPLVAEGELPHIARLLREGARGPLASTIHPITSQAWATMFTGVNAGRHGMWDFCERDPSGYRLRLVNGSYRRAPTVWEMLSARGGRQSGIVNVPFTWPATEIDGFLIAGLDAAGRESGMTAPASLLGELQQRFGQLEFDHAVPLDSSGHVDLEQMRRASEQKTDAALWLAARYQPDLLIAVYMAVDHIQHYAWPEWEREGPASRVAEVYRMLDEAVGRLAEAADGDVIVVSDHGGGSLEGVVNLNAWLEREGFLTYNEGRRALRPSELGRLALYRALEQRRRLPRSVRNLAKQKAPGLRERAHELKEFTAIDWSRTRAFAYGNMGNVVINVRGRERQGAVEPGPEYDAVCEAIRERAADLRDPRTGEPLLRAVHRRDELCFGPQLAKVPDLIFEFASYGWAGKGNLMRRTPTIWDEILCAPDSREPYVGSHRSEGIAILAGPSIAPGATLAANAEDIAPTMLYLLDEEIPSDLEGRVLVEAMRDDRLDERPARFREPDELALATAHAYDQSEAAAVSDRLRGLGYIE